jgi:hypothetical protein
MARKRSTRSRVRPRRGPVARRRSNAGGWRSYGPGKFDSLVDSFLYAATLDGGADEEAGESETTGWNGLLEGNILKTARDYAVQQGEDLTEDEVAELRDTAAVILTENSQGFVTVDYYTDAKEARAEWEKIEAEVAEAEGDEDDY